jgi:hypothetical protein
MLGIRASDTGLSALWHVLYTVFIKDTIQVIRSGNIKDSRISDKLNYMMAGHISHKRGYDRGRSLKALENASELGLVPKVKSPKDDIDNTQLVENYIPDPHSEKERDLVENRLLLEEIQSRVTDKRDRLVMTLYKEIANGSTLEGDMV